MSPPLAIFSTPQQQAQAQEQVEEPTTTTKIIPWQLYPSCQFEQLQATHGKKVKLVHMVRHAEGTHNVEENYKDSQNIDARLTPKGKQQCDRLAQRLAETLSREDVCVVTSPMTRCVQTALHSFSFLAETNDIRFVAHESWRETVNFNCDRRRRISEIAQEFPRVDFSLCRDDVDSIWESYRQRLSEDWDRPMESAELHAVAKRALEGFQMLETIPQNQVVVCTHSAFLRCGWSWGQSGGVPQLIPQGLDERLDKTNHKLFEYNGCGSDFEEYMRADYDNCEMRSFCFLVQDNNE
jgi:broad specificity phosphatase PhoE